MLSSSHAQLLPKMQLYSSPLREGFFPFKMQNAKSPQILTYKLYLILFYLFFVFVFVFFFIIIIIISFFFPKTWNSFPKWKSYSPAFGGNNIRIDAPAHTYTYYIHILHTHTTYTYYIQNQWSHSLFLNYVQVRQKWRCLNFFWRSCEPTWPPSTFHKILAKNFLPL